jgi:hypothetical protein
MILISSVLLRLSMRSLEVRILDLEIGDTRHESKKIDKRSRIED